VERRLLTVREAGQYLNLSESILYKLVWRKKIPHTRIGRKVLFDIQKLNRFIEDNSFEVNEKK